MTDKITLIILAIVLFLVPPIIVNVLYSFNAPVPTMAAQFEATGLLGYIGSICACVGTVYLGYVTLRQTRKIEEKNAEMMALRDRWERENTKRPFFSIDEVVKGGPAELMDTGAYHYCVPLDRNNLGPRVRLVNLGDGPAINLRFVPEESLWRSMPAGPKLTCPPGDNVDVEVFFHWSDERRRQMIDVGALYYENMLGQAYLQRFKALMADRGKLQQPSGRVLPPCYEVIFEPIGSQEVSSEK